MRGDAKMDAAALRRWAMEYATQADDPTISGQERKRLPKVRAAILEIAATRGWLTAEAAERLSQWDNTKKSPRDGGR
jgi:hypothetical protein